MTARPQILCKVIILRPSCKAQIAMDLLICLASKQPKGNKMETHVGFDTPLKALNDYWGQCSWSMWGILTDQTLKNPRMDVLIDNSIQKLHTHIWEMSVQWAFRGHQCINTFIHWRLYTIRRNLSKEPITHWNWIHVQAEAEGFSILMSLPNQVGIQVLRQMKKSLSGIL